ncbi:MAG: hypothetical protein ACK5LC_08685 [Coprobacillaceae bacterium]
MEERKLQELKELMDEFKDNRCSYSYLRKELYDFRSNLSWKYNHSTSQNMMLTKVQYKNLLSQVNTLLEELEAS